ncbi:hypothetical protein BC628DRAFT_633591 [Trametes gibbosa]|nr:hypothetical protein BC628DRAFT_633591 [Trametes gibbosa]
MSDNTTHREPEASLPDAGQSDFTDLTAGPKTEPSATVTAPPPKPTNPPTKYVYPIGLQRCRPTTLHAAVTVLARVIQHHVTTKHLSSQVNEDEDDDFFIPRGKAVQTAAGGGKKGGRPRKSAE